MAFDEQHAKALRHSEEWRQAALAFEHRAMRDEYVIRLLVAAGYVSQEKVDEAFNIARDFKRASGVTAADAHVTEKLPASNSLPLTGKKYAG